MPDLLLYRTLKCLNGLGLTIHKRDNVMADYEERRLHSDISEVRIDIQ